MGPPCFLQSPSIVLSLELTPDLSFDSITCLYNDSMIHIIIYFWDPLMVTVISIARKSREGQFPDSLTDYILHLNGRLSVENALFLGERLSSLGA